MVGSFSYSSRARLQQRYQEKEDLVGSDIMRQTERIVMLQVIDNQMDQTTGTIRMKAECRPMSASSTSVAK